MTITLNASTASGLVVTPDNSGNILLQYNGQSAPTFQAYKAAAAQSITSSTWTKVTFDVEEWDTNNNFASSRFTPTVAGYYQINASVDLIPSSGTATRASIRIYQNGSATRNGTELQISNITEVGVIASALVYCNGTTDYVEIYALMTATSPLVQNYGTYFQGCLLRGA